MRRGGIAPSRWLVAACGALLGRDRAAALAGDLAEEAARDDASRFAAAWPRVWCDLQLAKLTGAACLASVPRAGRAVRFVVRDAWRGLRAAPTTTAFALVVLTLGIGAATITFSVVDAVVLRQLPFDHAEQLVMVTTLTGPDGEGSRAFAPQEILAWQGRLGGFESWAAMMRGSESLGTDATREPVPALVTMASLFDVLRVHAMVGRLFTAEDEQPGRAPVVVIGSGLWQRQFGGDPAAIGQHLTLRAGAATIVGVLPPGSEFPMGADRPYEIWEPYVMRLAERALPQGGLSSYLAVVGRLRAGASPEIVQSQIVAATQPLMAAYPFNYKTAWPPRVVPLYDWLVGPYRLWMLLALSAVVAVLLIACVNVANLQLTRSSERARELAVRASLGATRRHLLVAMLAESIMLSGIAAALALLLSVEGIALAKAALPTSLPRLWTVGLDARVFAAAVCGALATGLLFGAVPAWHASRMDVASLLKDSGPALSGVRRRWQSAFLVSEVALSAALLVVVTLLVASFVQVMRETLGFERHGTAVVTLRPQRGTSIRDVTDRLSAVPGVLAAAAFSGSSAPLINAAGLGGGSSSTTIVDRDAAPGTRPTPAEFRTVTPEYFGVAGMRFLSGATFDAAGPPGIVIDDLAAARTFGNRPVVGAAVLTASRSALTVTGVVAHVQANGPEGHTGPQVYLPMRSDQQTSGQYLLRLGQPVEAVTPAIDAALAPFQPAGADPPRVSALDDAFWLVTKERRFIALLMAAFGVVAVFIGAAGVYGVMASVVAQQSRELAVRVALGATAGDLSRTVHRQAGRYVLVGLALGLPAAASSARLFASLLFGVQPGDFRIYVIVAGLMMAAGFLAAFVPARRAARVDPIATLKRG